ANEAGGGSGRQFAFPLLGSSITTVAAFLPLFLLSGAQGEYAFSLGAVVALTLTGSWIAALYILPPLTVWLLGKRHDPASSEASPSRISSGYGRAVNVAIGL